MTNRMWIVAAAAVMTVLSVSPLSLAQKGDPDFDAPDEGEAGMSDSTPAPQQEGDAPKNDTKADAKDADKGKVTAGLLGALRARGIGPALMSGRVGDIAVNPAKPSEFYVAVSSGGIWKTTNAGVTFAPIFDSYGSFSIGCLALDPSNPSVLWVGSGENNSQRSVSWGDGVYVSRDSGKSFKNVGLKESEHIGMIAVHPGDSNTVYVAAQGPLWKSGGERGLYKTTDGGATWNLVLTVSEQTGINEVHFDPRNPDVLYATAYQRRRHVWTLINGGPESAIYKSTDGGEHWRKLESGIPGVDKGRIGLAISPANSDVLYAIVEAAEGEGGVFRSTDRGETWTKRSSYMTSSPQYYNELHPDPKNVDRFYAFDTFLHVSADGGATVKRVPETDKHVDNHAMWINPANTDHILVGCDGGLYETFDRTNWRFFGNLPVTQFYRVGIDNSEPFYFVYGGTQDNNTQGGPSRTTDRAGITTEDWFITTGGDGFETVVDPVDPNTVYSESQDGGLVRYDRKSGEEVDIKPASKPGEKPYVFNWDTPLIISPFSPTRLYYAGNYLLRSDDRGNTWTRISEDLTRGIDRNQLKVMDKIQKPEAVAKHASTSIFGNAVALSESPKVEGLIYVGTDDGLVHTTEDGGKTWRKIENFPVVPDMSYVSALCASRHNADVVYACFDNHKMGDFLPYILRSDDRGRSWKPIAGDLSKRDTVYCIVEDTVRPDMLFCGTEYGCYVTLDGGTKWMKVAGLPTIAVRDLEIQRRENDLVMATFGRGFYIVDDYSPMRLLSEEILQKPAFIFPVKKALSYVEKNRLGGQKGRGWSGASYYQAPNPPYGAVITYHLKDKPKTKREIRKEAEKKDDWKYPTLDEFRAEDRETEPQLAMLIRDASQNVIRRIPVGREPGLQRIAWNLRYPGTRPTSLSTGERLPWESDVEGVLVPPGTYSAQLCKVEAGMTETLGDAVMFEVADLNAATLAAKGDARSAKFAFERKAADLQRAVEGTGRVIGEADTRLTFLKKAAADTPGMITADALNEIERLRQRLTELRTTLYGDSTLAKRVVAQPPSIAERAGIAAGISITTTQPPTGTQMEQYAFAAAEFEKLLADVKTLVGTDLVALEKKLEAAGAPWTPGRMPEWKK